MTHDSAEPGRAVASHPDAQTATQPPLGYAAGDDNLDASMAAGNDEFTSRFRQSGDSLRDFLSFAAKLASAVESLHQQGLIHGAITPAVIVVDQSTETIQLLTGMRSDRWLNYIAPEQTGRMNRLIDERTDLYALGVVYYQALTGHLPFVASDPLSLIHALMAVQPVPLTQLRPDLPPPVADIVTKLLARDPRDRYQSADGLERDLTRCQENWQRTGRIEPFVLGEADVPHRLLLPQRLYGRAAELDRMLQVFEEARRGAAQLVLVSGQAGVGKTSLISELVGPVVASGGTQIFARIDTGDSQPLAYSAVISALEDFVDQILAGDPAQLGAWKDKLTKALSGNTHQLIARIPSLARIIEAPTDLASEAGDPKTMLALALHATVQAIAGADHSLVMVIDDAQWADAESWQLVRALTTGSDLHLLVICSFRQEPGAHNDLVSFLPTTPADRHLALSPLSLVDTTHFLADTLHATPSQLDVLASLIYEKTDGNPFFLREFLRSLSDNGLIFFDSHTRSWQWSMAGIQAAPITDNVVALVLSRLQQLPELAHRTLKVAAIMGNQFDIQDLSAACQQPASETYQHLLLGVKLGALAPVALTAYPLSRLGRPVEPRLAAMEKMASEFLAASSRDKGAPRGGQPRPKEGDHQGNVARKTTPLPCFEFSHAQIREAAALLLPELATETIRAQIGRGLLEGMTPEQRQENSLYLVRYLNGASAMPAAWPERIQLAELNLLASRRALALGAYENACSLAEYGAATLKGDPHRDPWQEAYHHMRDLHLEAAQAAAYSGQFEQAGQLLQTLDHNARGLLDSATITQVRMLALYLQGMHEETIATAVQALRRLGVRLPTRPRNQHVLAAMARTRLAMLGRSIGSLADLPPMTGDRSSKAMEIMAAATISAASVQPKLLTIIGLEMVWQTVKHGRHPLSAMGYALHGVLLAGVLGQIDAGYAFGQLALNLAPQIRSKQHRVFAKYFVYAHINHWKEPVSTTLQPLRDLASTGEFEYLAVAAGLYSYFTWFIDGQNVETHERSIAKNLHLLEPFRDTPLHYRYLLGQQFYQNLLGHASDPCRMSGNAYDERQLQQFHLQANDRTTLFYLACHQLILSYLFGCYGAARDAARLAVQYRDGGVGTPLIPVLCFYESLACLAHYPSLQGVEASKVLRTVAANQRKMRQWACFGPANCLHRHTLVEAERARLKGDHTGARELYDAAIREANEQDYEMELAVAHELAARFYLEIELPAYAEVHLRAAHDSYRAWGALGKVRQLEGSYPQVFRGTVVDGAVSLADLSTYLDMASVLKAAQVLSSETGLPQLLDKLVTIMTENAGAQRGYLLLPDGGEWRVAASYPVTTDNDKPQPNRPPLPMSVVRQVARSREPLLLNDAVAAIPHQRDPHLLSTQPHSILCLPLLDQGDLVGVFYLENRLTSNAFPPHHLQSLTMLASQAAISLKNASLVTGLQEAQDHFQTSERRFRLLFESVPLGIFEIDISEATPKIRAANRRAEATYGWSSAELSILDPAFLIPDESRHEIQRVVEAVRAGKTAVLESTNRRKDGVVFPVRIIATPGGDERSPRMIVAIEDITAQQQRRSEAEAIDAERLRIAQEIHDGVAQDLAALRLKLTLWRDWVETEPERMQDELSQTRDTLDAAIEEIRRSIYALRPLALDEVGLLAALPRYIADFNDQHNVYVDLQIDVAGKSLPADLELPLFRVVQEALNNVVQHAGASLAWVRLEAGEDAITLTIRDNGRGFDVAALSGGGRSGHLGLIQMRERINQAGGELTVHSQPRIGTEIKIDLPLG